jgi:hypothetical protein
LQRFDLKVPVVAAIGTSQRHLITPLGSQSYVMAVAGRNANMAGIW